MRSAIRDFLRTLATSGLVLIGAAACAMRAANGRAADGYFARVARAI